MRCTKCGAENPEQSNFCPKCGAKFVPRVDVGVAGEDGAYYCFRHKKEITRVTCGKCEKPICPRCMVMSAAGVRCQECARNKVATRWRGVAHDVTSGVSRFDIRRAWIYYLVGSILLAILARFIGFFR